MTISKKNQPSEESVGNAPYYRTSSPLDDRVQQALYSTKHLQAAKGIKMREMEIVPLNVQDPATPVGCPVVLYDESGHAVPAKSDVEYRLQHVLEKEGIGTKLTPLLDHGNSHNREMLTGSKITDCYGSKGVVVRVLDDTEMPKATGAEVEYAEYDLHAIAKKLVSSEVWRELRFIINQLADVFGKEKLLEMAQNKHAPAVDVYSYINNTVDAAGAMYIERAIGEQYGLRVLNKAKEAKASRIGAIKAARSAD